MTDYWYGIPGDVDYDNTGLTQRVLDAVEKARLNPHDGHHVTDADGPHRHHFAKRSSACAAAADATRTRTATSSND